MFGLSKMERANSVRATLNTAAAKLEEVLGKKFDAGDTGVDDVFRMGVAIFNLEHQSTSSTWVGFSSTERIYAKALAFCLNPEFGVGRFGVRTPIFLESDIPLVESRLKEMAHLLGMEFVPKMNLLVDPLRGWFEPEELSAVTTNGIVLNYQAMIRTQTSGTDRNSARGIADKVCNAVDANAPRLRAIVDDITDAMKRGYDAVRVRVPDLSAYFRECPSFVGYKQLRGYDFPPRFH